MKFRLLEAHEIECRVSTVKENGLSLLIYKDARVDMNILDETVTQMGWQRKHYELKGNIYCSVGIYDKDSKEWVYKDDAGSESNTEAVKGEASDSFKRACFNWGIGRELYSAPFIWVSSDKCSITKRGDRFTCYDRFTVEKIKYNDKGEITGIAIVNDKTKAVVYYYNSEK